MKKLLVFLLTFILTFSCFCILSVTTILAEEQTAGQEIIKSDFENFANSNWRNTGAVEILNEENNGVKEYFARFSGGSSAARTYSYTAKLIPNNKYELSCYIRVPEGVGTKDFTDYQIKNKGLHPMIVIHRPGNTGVGEQATNNFKEGSTEYANKNLRSDFEAEWTYGSYGPITYKIYSMTNYHTAPYYNVCQDSPNVTYKTWQKVTATFEAIGAEEIISLSFGIPGGAPGLVFDLKEVKLVKTTSVEPEQPEDIVLPDNIPEYPAVIEKTESTGGNIETNVSGENCHAFVTKAKAVSGEKVAVSAAPFAGYKFVGWYENDELVTAEKHFTFNASENRNLVAKVEPLTEKNKQISIAPDLNYDGVVGLEDVSSLAKKLAGWEIENVNDIRADVDGDGKANLCDLVLAAQYVAGWDVQDKLASKEAYYLPEEDLTAEGLGDIVRAGESEYFNRSTILNEGNRALFVKLFEKAKRGEKITVASIGGSITQGVKDNSGQDRSYGQLVSEWIAGKFNVEVENINAGIGSTGSLMGVHRLQSDVLSKNPDLVILEFSVNDISSMQGKFAYLETYEAIIRRVLEKDIALMTAVFGGTGAKFYTEYLSLHIHSALHYDLPIIDYYSALFRYLDSGVIKWYDANDKQGGGITQDNLHPNLAGHVMISSAMNYYLEDVYNKYTAGKVFETAIDLPEETLFENTNLYSTATFYAGDNTLGYEVATPLFNEGFNVGRVEGNSAKLGKGWVCSSGNGVIIFEFKNITSLLIPMMNSKNYSGKYSIEINGVTKKNNVSVDQANNATWPIYAKAFDKASDVVIKITCHEGTVGVGSIGVTY